ncbi:hypothetical protein C7212DRAFT_361486 [Tuber magnatum]|uniref:AB hydrolase-1 domain-containing protein n=1 Tax=Tuber magnatum TaxID=42249 RepID=A0A317T000_9PEZI|nr:hypothetical protein C7212DRAFT_361486 [Tuber magnatum]
MTRMTAKLPCPITLGHTTSTATARADSWAISTAKLLSLPIARGFVLLLLLAGGSQSGNAGLHLLRIWPDSLPRAKWMLLLVYIHDPMGNETSFQRLPDHLHNLLSPKFKTGGSISVAKEGLPNSPSQFGNPGTDAILLTHSIGGILAAEVVLLRNAQLGAQGGRGGGSAERERVGYLADPWSLRNRYNAIRRLGTGEQTLEGKRIRMRFINYYTSSIGHSEDSPKPVPVVAHPKHSFGLADAGVEGPGGSELQETMCKMHLEVNSLPPRAHSRNLSTSAIPSAREMAQVEADPIPDNKVFYEDKPSGSDPHTYFRNYNGGA